ncbi:ADP-ribose 1''-phosphate phosphatase [Purpureocillium takamizusanense]|uniref:ADP-ribose 1''-phosphate phosphatase n=1 Tax=Purpureocillium takamizusanense TaxID=2060973 RepID=A0A9Q8QHE5_9HYPO|nr:ADP-ribose 1''-phosphate phosphatase [Purpureocillium takamizusanense]UNI19241.1 ADP-ribose 1''-phosphate phosphatase [Purpureocillium takamizusanense]
MPIYILIPCQHIGSHEAASQPLPQTKSDGMIFLQLWTTEQASFAASDAQLLVCGMTHLSKRQAPIGASLSLKQGFSPKKGTTILHKPRLIRRRSLAQQRIRLITVITHARLGIHITTPTMADQAPPFALESASIPLRDLPADSYLVHATNCIATWGAGIAAEMADIFPAACREYQRFCVEEVLHGPETSSQQQQQQHRRRRWPTSQSPIAGRCLVIPPQDDDVRAGAPRVHIVCLFTSNGFGRADPARGKPGRDAPGRILEQTARSLKEFRTALERAASSSSAVPAAQTDEPAGSGSGDAASPVVYSPMFNSGAFRVPWEQTQALIRGEFRGWRGRWVVLAPPGPA